MNAVTPDAGTAMATALDSRVTPGVDLSPPPLVELRLRDGTRVGGYLLRATIDAYHVRTDGGVRALAKTTFLAIERRAAETDGGARVATGIGRVVVLGWALVGSWRRWRSGANAVGRKEA